MNIRILDKYVNANSIRKVSGSYFSENGFRVLNHYRFGSFEKISIVIHLWERGDEHAVRISDHRCNNVYFLEWSNTVECFYNILRGYSSDIGNVDIIIFELLNICKYKNYFGNKYGLK